MLSILVAVILTVVAGTGGVLYAAEGAGPGDPLYGVDRAVESVRLGLTSDSEDEAELLVAFASERLLEAEELSGQGDQEHLEQALSGYLDTISAIAQTLGTADVVDQAALAAMLNEAFSVHEDRLASIFQSVDGDGDPDDEGDEESDRCADIDAHPVAKRLAESYDGVSYDEIMDWFCNGGYGFGEIVHALQTSQEIDDEVSPADLLNMKSEMGGWGQVWKAEGLIGPPEGRPVGPPENSPVGPPEGRPVGPPEDKPARPPEGRPVGPPEDKPAGPPEGRPVGPPEGRPVGPPEGRPVGPPEGRPVGPPEGRPVGPHKVK